MAATKESMIDAFLELKKRGKPAIEGETLDKVFGAAHRRAMQLNSFTLESQIDLASRESASAPPSTAPGTTSGRGLLDSSGTDDDLLGGGDEEDFFTFTIEKDVDNATPHLFQFYCKHWTSTRSPGKVPDGDDIFDEAKVTVRKASGKAPIEYLVFEFRGVWIKSWELKGKGDELPDEQIEFAFDACQMRYWPQKLTGARGVMIPSGFFDFRASNKMG